MDVCAQLHGKDGQCDESQLKIIFRGVCEYSRLTELRLTDGFSEKVKFVPKIDECRICPNLWKCNLGRREIITEKEEGDLAACGIRSDQSGSKL